MYFPFLILLTGLFAGKAFVYEDLKNRNSKKASPLSESLLVAVIYAAALISSLVSFARDIPEPRAQVLGIYASVSAWTLVVSLFINLCLLVQIWLKKMVKTGLWILLTDSLAALALLITYLLFLQTQGNPLF